MIDFYESNNKASQIVFDIPNEMEWNFLATSFIDEAGSYVLVGIPLLDLSL